MKRKENTTNIEMAKLKKEVKKTLKRVTKKKEEKPSSKTKETKKTFKKVNKIKRETEETKIIEAPIEIVEGITDSLEQVDIRELLPHSGEGEQKTRANLEEELAETSWRPREEENAEGFNYGGIKKDSDNKSAYVENRGGENKNPVEKLYEGMNPYSTSEGQENFYDADHSRVENKDQIGQIRLEDRSQLEIQGLSRKEDTSFGNNMEGHRQNENYE